jgi:hypothetical protein
MSSTTSSLGEKYTQGPPSSKARFTLDSYVEYFGGDKVIKRVLICSNGNAATKGIR